MAAVVATFFLWSLPVGAQTALQDSIASRTRPHTNPIGMVVGPYGSFLLSPEFTLDTQFTDNVFSVESGKLADVFFSLKPKIDLRSDWVNHSLNFSSGAIQTKYIDNVEENFLDYDFGVTGRLDVLDKSNLTASLAFQKSTQSRGDVDDDVAGVFETEQTTSTKSTIQIGGLYNKDVYLVKLGYNLDLIDFDDAGTTDNDDRDRIEFKSTARVGYEWVPGSTVFVETTYDIRHFDTAVDNNGFKRSSRGYEFLIGNTLDHSAVTFAEQVRFAAGISAERLAVLSRNRYAMSAVREALQETPELRRQVDFHLRRL